VSDAEWKMENERKDKTWASRDHDVKSADHWQEGGFARQERILGKERAWQIRKVRS